jgi:N-acetylgalactosamine-6-sulfatase
MVIAMHNPHLIFLPLLLLLAGGLQAKSPPNIVFLLADDLGYGDLGCYGHPYAKTPAIDQLAREGMMFRSAYVAGPTCEVSRCGFMTGLFPARFAGSTRQLGFGASLTVTEVLKQKGYQTGLFGKWDMGEEKTQGTYGIEEIHVIPSELGDPKGKDFRVTEAAIDFIKRNREGPFYMNVWFHTPHHPVAPHATFVSRFENMSLDRPDFPNPHYQARLDAYENLSEDPTTVLREYLGDVSQLDDQVEKILSTIRELGIEEETVVLFASDNGPARPVDQPRSRSDGKKNPSRQNGLGSAGPLRGGKHGIYEGGIRVPWIVRWPGRIASGKIMDREVIAGVDLLPTLCSIAGVDIDTSGLDGEDVSDIWFGKERSRRKDLFWISGSPGSPRAVLRRGDWKLCIMQNGAQELYDLANDPGESRNVAADHPGILLEMGDAIDRWIGTLMPAPKWLIDAQRRAAARSKQVPARPRLTWLVVAGALAGLFLGIGCWRRMRTPATR